MDVPAPPLATAADALRFTRLLAVHVASLDAAAVTLSTFTLASILGSVESRLRHLAPADAAPPLPRFVLTVALLTRFPAPWTPAGLLAAIEGGEEWSSVEAEPSDVLRWSDDPESTAERTADGWTVTRTERGLATVVATGLDDAGLVAHLLDEVRLHPYPYGWRSDDLPGRDAVVRAGLREREEWAAGHGDLPYLRTWIAERDAAAGSVD